MLFIRVLQKANLWVSLRQDLLLKHGKVPQDGDTKGRRKIACKHFLKHGSCDKGNDCPYSHKLARQQRLQKGGLDATQKTQGRRAAHGAAIQGGNTAFTEVDNIIENLEYKSIDTEGNQYLLKSKSANESQENKNILSSF